MDRNIRDYEVSIWTLQDEFITVLKHSKTENKGKIQDPDFDLKNDGTLTFTFSLPMYLNNNGVRTENPIWFNTRNGNIIADLRKVKVIFNKNTNEEEVFELLITKVTEKHEGFELTCEVETEGLAFYELGKIGYKIALNEDTYLDEWNKWFEEDGTSEHEPHNNIDYWSHKVLDDTNWIFEVQMDWTGWEARASNKIYEDAFAADWKIENDVLIPASMVAQKEKERLIDVEESNIYNITQTIAETFGVHCRYEYIHNEDYHIIGRKVIYYNNFIQEKLGELDINYAYNTEEISREIDSKDTVTKMFVKTLQDSNTESGLATIMDTTANKSGEDYLLNFDYLYAIGNITQEQYDEVPKYEALMHQFNEQLKLIENQLAALDDKLIDAKAEAAVAKNSISLDQERISAANDLLNALTNNTGILQVTDSRPDTCAAIESSDNKYYINVRQKGIIATSIKIYKTYDSAASSNKLTNQVTSGIIEYDEFNNIIKINNLSVDFASNAAKILYLIYDYTPQLYYENIRKVWESRLAKDTDNYNIQSQLVATLEERIDDLKESQDELLEDKEAAIKRFERLMGPAIREGYWQPEDEYAKYGERHNDNLTLSTTAIFNDNLASIGWDTVLFDDEQDISYKMGIDSNIEYYQFVDLSDEPLDIFTDYKDNLNKISFIYQDTSAPENSENDLLYLHFLSIGSQSQLAFLKRNDVIKPILLITGLKGVNLETIKNFRIGILTTEIDENDPSIINVNITDILSPATITSGVSTDKIVYPRIRINSNTLKNSEDKLNIKISNKILSNYEDYYILSREDVENEGTANEISYFRNYITFKPELLFKLGTYPTFNLYYELANTGLIIYLDAMQVLRENAYPHVSYSIKPTLMNENFTQNAHKYLNRIVHINDYELKFENVQGYISELHLKLDSPKDDDITIENYKTKFEDLFSSIVVQTEQMQKNSVIIGMTSQAFTNAGNLKTNVVQSVINQANLNYAFNNGTLTIDENDGIWGISDSGVVAFRGGGIFTATEKDENDEWIWNTGILPSGINASLITTGQLDTNLIRVFAGDDLKFQLNGDGLFAYKSWWDDAAQHSGISDGDNRQTNGLDLGQYVVHNSEGLFLIAKEGTKYWNGTQYVQLNSGDVERVSISWDGLTLRNWNKDKVFYADADTGNLTVEGIIRAKELVIIDTNNNATNINTYINNFTNFSINGSANATVAINPTDGIKVTDNNNNYFQVTATQMGFWKYVGIDSITNQPIFNQKLGFTNGDLFLSGQLIASEGSNIAGWMTNNTSIYKNSNIFGNDNGLYFGDDGLSIGDAFKVHATKLTGSDNYNFDYFTLGILDATSNLYPLSYQYDTDSQKYILSLNNVEFSDSTWNLFNSIALNTTIANNNVYTATSLSNLPQDVLGGSLGIIYDNNTSSSQTSSNYTFSYAATDELNPTPGAYLYTGPITNAGEQKVFYASTSTNKIYYNCQKAHAKESVASNFINYYRVGKGSGGSSNPDYDTSALAAAYFTIQNASISFGQTIQLNFNYSTDIVSGNPDHNCTPASQGGHRGPITVYFLSNGSNSLLKPSLNNLNDYFATPQTFTGNDGNTNAAIPQTMTLTTIKTLNNGDILWVVFFSDNLETLVYIDLKTISLTNPNSSPSPTPITPSVGLYVRSNNDWVLATDGTSGGSNSSINMDSGTISNFSNSGSVSKTVNFSKTFTSSPKVFCQYISTNRGSNDNTFYYYPLCVQNVTPTSFTVYSVHDFWSADWVAIEL